VAGAHNRRIGIEGLPRLEPDSGASSQFEAGKAAMMVNGPGTSQASPGPHVLRQAIWGRPVPVRVAGQHVIVPLGGEDWNGGASGGTAAQQLAFDYIEGMQSPSRSCRCRSCSGTCRLRKPLPRPSRSRKAAAWSVYANQTIYAHPRTLGLGVKYPKVSEAVWTAIQAGLSGSQSVKSALTTAQSQIKSIWPVRGRGAAVDAQAWVVATRRVVEEFLTAARYRLSRDSGGGNRAAWHDSVLPQGFAEAPNVTGPADGPGSVGAPDGEFVGHVVGSGPRRRRFAGNVPREIQKEGMEMLEGVNLRDDRYFYVPSRFYNQRPTACRIPHVRQYRRGTLERSSASAVTVTGSPVTLQVRLVGTAGAVHVLTRSDGVAAAPRLPLARELPEPQVRIEQERHELRLVGPSATVRIELEPVRVSIVAGALVLTEDRSTQDASDQLVTLPLGFMRLASGTIAYLESYVAEPDEHFYGLGERFTNFDKRGQLVSCWNHDALGCLSEQSYKNVPFFVSSRGYGVFVDTTTNVHFDLCHSSQATWSLVVPDEQLSYYVVLGEPASCLSQYQELVGGPELPPPWLLALDLIGIHALRRNRCAEHGGGT